MERIRGEERGEFRVCVSGSGFAGEGGGVLKFLLLHRR